MNRRHDSRPDTFNSSMATDVIPVILAAGAGSRLGQIKPLAPFYDSTFLGHILAQTNQLNTQVTVVLGAFAKEIAAHLQQGMLAKSINIVFNNNWQLGMSTSIHAAVAANPSAKALLFLTVDQVLITAEDLENLINVWINDPEKMVCASYAGTFGIPAVIPANYFDALMKLHGDKGAKQLLQNDAHSRYISLDNAKTDIDTPEQLASVQVNTSLSNTPTKDITA